jgi:hypothetical protein
VLIDEAGDEAVVADQPLRGELLENRRDLLRRVPFALELAPQLRRGVLAAGKQPHGGCFGFLRRRRGVPVGVGAGAAT